MRRAYERPLIEAREHLADEDYAFVPGRSDRSGHVVQNVIGSTSLGAGIRPKLSRMRATWIVGLILDGVPYGAVTEAAGMIWLRPYERWLKSSGTMTRAQYRAWTRGM